MVRGERQDRLWWASVGAAVVVGLALRIAAAQGGLWTDEAWSVIYAAEARDAAGVFLRINHDNNHHLYSLWLQAVGMDAPPLLARAPAIVAGTVCIPIAALLLARRSVAASVVVAVLFAISPTFVNFGSEARGYSMMLLATLTMLWLITEAIEARERRGTPWWLAITAALGMLSHMTMAAPVALAAAWVYLDRRSALGAGAAMRETARLMGPAFAATAAVVLFVFAAAAASSTGMRLGGYIVFNWRDFAGTIDDLVNWTLGSPVSVRWLALVALVLVASWISVQPPDWLAGRSRLYALLILGVPIGAAIFHPGNSGFGRYYLSSAVAILLIAAEWIGREFDRRQARRIGAAIVLGALAVGCLWRDSQLIALQRGHPDAAVALIAGRSPVGPRVAVAEPRLTAVLTLGARRARLPLSIVGGCAPAQFLLAARPSWVAAPTMVERCGVPMRIFASAVTTPLSGEGWALYVADSLQTNGRAVSGRAPGGH